MELARTPTTLPHVDNLINVLVLDSADPAAAQLGKEEALRVVAPGGAVFVRRGGKWESMVKPADPAFGVWTHPHGDASNNGVSDDQELAPVSTIRFIDGIGRGEKTMAGTGGIPVVGSGMIVCSDPRGYLPHPREDKTVDSHRLIGRDAHSGLNKWAIPVDANRAFLAIDGNFLISAYPEPGQKGDLFIHDLHTGKLLHSIESGLEKVNADSIDGIVHGGTAWVVIENQLLACDLATGKILWKKEAEGFDSWFSPGLTPDGKRFVIVESGDRKSGFKERWPWTKIHAITALDPATGKELWRDESLRGEYSMHVPLTDKYAFFAAPWGIGSHYEKIARDQRDKLPRGARHAGCHHRESSLEKGCPHG